MSWFNSVMQQTARLAAVAAEHFGAFSDATEIELRPNQKYMEEE